MIHPDELALDALEIPDGSEPPLAPAACAVEVEVVPTEHRWRCPPQSTAVPMSRHPGLLVSRWLYDGTVPLEVAHPGDAERHCVALALRSSSMRLKCGGKPVIDGRLPAGAVQVTAPATHASAVFDSASDILHLHVPQNAVAECHIDLYGRAPDGDIVLHDPFPYVDPALERLGQALVVAHRQDPGVGRVFAESVAMAILSRVVASHVQHVAIHWREQSKLPPWRLRRALEYIDANLASPIGLADIASSTGLTRMYFAAQFRRATGMRPHEYLLRRRIEHAQDLLRHAGYRVLDVALRCGFRSQAHFTTVFKRFVGDTPHCWRVKVASTSGSSHA